MEREVLRRITEAEDSPDLSSYEGGEGLEELIGQIMGTLKNALLAVGPLKAPGLKAAFLRAIQSAVSGAEIPPSPRARRLPGGGVEIREPGGAVYRSEGE